MTIPGSLPEMCGFCTWKRGLVLNMEHGGAELMVELDLGDIFQHYEFYDFKIEV